MAVTASDKPETSIWCDVVWQLPLRINLRPQFSGPHTRSLEDEGCMYLCHVCNDIPEYTASYRTHRLRSCWFALQGWNLHNEERYSYFAVYDDVSNTRWLYDIHMMKWKGIGRKRSLPNLRGYYFCIFLERKRKNAKSYTGGRPVSRLISNRHSGLNPDRYTYT